jgi:hypothetical protein
MKLRILLFVIYYCASIISVKAQISGTVFRDYNGNGTLELTGVNRDTVVYNVTVKAYSIIDALIATKTTLANGTYSFTAGEIASGTKVRLEFTLPLTACLNKNIDFPGFFGSNNASSVQFVAGGATNVHYAINNPNDYQTILNPDVFTPLYRSGNSRYKRPPAGDPIQSYDSSGFISFAYNNSSPTATNPGIRPTELTKMYRIGTCWGVAYSKQSTFIYTSAMVKRHSSMGLADGEYNNAPGSIYIIKRGVDSGSYYHSLDALADNTFWTHDHTKPIYNISTGALITPSPTFHVQKSDSFKVSATITTNIGTRELHPNIYVKVPDTGAFKQVARVGLGGLEISEDGRYLYTINMYNNSIVRIDMQNANTPVVPTLTQYTKWTLPALTAPEAAKSILRPFGLKFYRDKLYIGAVLDASISGLKADLEGRVYEFDPALGTFTQILSHKLDYKRKTPLIAGTTAGKRCDDASSSGWYAWNNRFDSCGYDIPRRTVNINPQPILADIEFDKDGSMILSYSDRNGHTGGISQRSNIPSNLGLYDSYVNGDILRAYRKNDCLFEIETNAKEGASSGKAATVYAGNNEGPINGSNYGEFYGGDSTTTSTGIQHPDCAGGGIALLMSKSEVLTDFVDAMEGQSNGVVKINNQNGKRTSAYSIYLTNTLNPGTQGKSHGLGDLEIVKPVSPIELGNRVWNDINYSGIQDGNEVGIAGVEFTLYTDPNGDGNVTDGVAIGTVMSDANGNYLFSSATGISATGVTYRLTILPFTNYVVRMTNATIDTNGNISVDFITGDSYPTIKTLSNITGTGEPDWSDNDGLIYYPGSPSTFAYYQQSVTTGKNGENNNNIDFGMASFFYVLSNKFIQLNGSINKNETTLNWELENKNEVQEYIVERSIDGVTFITIETIFNKDVLTQIDNVNNLNTAFVYYRIKLIEKTGRIIFSNTVKLKTTNYFVGKIMQNPVAENIKLEINSAKKENVKLELISTNGQLILTNQIKIGEGENAIVVPLKHSVSNGLYVLKLTSKENTLIFKLVVNN